MEDSTQSSVHIDFYLGSDSYVPVLLNDDAIASASHTPFLELQHFDQPLTWRTLVIKKRLEFLDTSEINVLDVATSHSLSLYHRSLLYLTILQPVWMYGLLMWGCKRQLHAYISTFLQYKRLHRYTCRRTT